MDYSKYKIDYEYPGRAVWRLQDEDGNILYVKRCTPPELEQTQNAANMQMPPESLLRMPPLIESGNNMHDIRSLGFSDDVANQITGWQPTRHYGISPDCFMVLTPVPNKDTLINILPDDRGTVHNPNPYTHDPIKADEYDQLIVDFQLLNDNGIGNGDLTSNVFLSRENGKTIFYMIDMAFGLDEPNTDVNTLQRLRQTLEEKGVLEQRTAHIAPPEGQENTDVEQNPIHRSQDKERE